MKPVLPALLNIDTDRLRDELVSQPGRWMLWPGSDRVSVPTNDALRLRILAGKVLPELEGRLEVRVPRNRSERGLRLRLVENAGRVRSYDRSARMPEKTRALLVAARPDDLGVRARSVYGAGWSMAHIAEALGVSRQWVSVLLSRTDGQDAPVLGPEHQRPYVMSLPDSLNSYRKVRQELDEAVAVIGEHRLANLLILRQSMPAHGEPTGGRDSELRARVTRFWAGVNELVDEGVSVRILSVLLDITPSAVYVMRSRSREGHRDIDHAVLADSYEREAARRDEILGGGLTLTSRAEEKTRSRVSELWERIRARKRS